MLEEIVSLFNISVLLSLDYMEKQARDGEDGDRKVELEFDVTVISLSI